MPRRTVSWKPNHCRGTKFSEIQLLPLPNHHYPAFQTLLSLSFDRCSRSIAQALSGDLSPERLQDTSRRRPLLWLRHRLLGLGGEEIQQLGRQSPVRCSRKAVDRNHRLCLLQSHRNHHSSFIIKFITNISCAKCLASQSNDRSVFQTSKRLGLLPR